VSYNFHFRQRNDSPKSASNSFQTNPPWKTSSLSPLAGRTCLVQSFCFVFRELHLSSIHCAREKLTYNVVSKYKYNKAFISKIFQFTSTSLQDNEQKNARLSFEMCILKQKLFIYLLHLQMAICTYQHICVRSV
jgi:hypothetical protein